MPPSTMTTKAEAIGAVEGCFRVSFGDPETPRFQAVGFDFRVSQKNVD